MYPASFKESNDVLGAPGNAPGVNPLSIYRGKTREGDPVIVSCFKVSAEELREIQRTGRVWLMVMGETMPPVRLDARKPI